MLRRFGIAFFHVLMVASWLPGETPWHAGLSRVDVTPTEPVRLSGYGSRDRISEGVDTPLFVRCLALRHRSQPDTPLLLISADVIGIPGALTRELTEAIKSRHGIPRDKVVICSTHTHTGPHVTGLLSNIFSVSLRPEELAASHRYKAQLVKRINEAVELALEKMRPAVLSYDVGSASFAANRRVLTKGKWSGFGVQDDGPVDHSVPAIRISGPDGSVRGVVFNYACHGTTISGRLNRINAEWCGYACEYLESKYDGAIAMCTIGCGADANPNPKGTVELAKVHGRTLAGEVERLVRGQMKPVDEKVTTAFEYAALSFDLPTAEELKLISENAKPQAKRHADHLLQIYETKRRLPATYPVPIQAWQFGEQLKMIFIGGEVVVDYALRLKKQLDDPKLWVTAYANDVPGYIASERMRAELGYEYDKSGVYYGLPGPWAAGTEDLLISRIQHLLAHRGRAGPLAPGDAKKTIRVPEGFRVELVAAEPVIQDPVNFAFGPDGKLWVVEMGDYPDGTDGGRIKVLRDTDGDGTYDSAKVYLANLAFPTGVFPWRDGVLVTTAPDILFARDTDGDGQADDVNVVYTGFKLANPQHRISGFSYGLDHTLHLSSGDNLGSITSVLNQQTVDASGHDIKIWPDDGRIEATSGRTQYIRSRNDWGEWFGNDNSKPMYHYPIEDRYLRRHSASRFSTNAQQLFDPPVAPPVFPINAATERFNDLFAANRFTSACSTIVARTPHFAVGSDDVAFVCEPVHHLVHRAVLKRRGPTYAATRSKTETDSEFIASSDPWFRPVRVAVGPDGMLWVADMYRQTIEHPKWIPESWQQQLDLRSGDDRGRLYRIVTEDAAPVTPIDLANESTFRLVQRLRSPIGTVRDLAQQVILERNDDQAIPWLQGLAASEDEPLGRVHALSILDVMSQLPDESLVSAFRDNEPGVILVVIGLAESRIDRSASFLDALQQTASHPDRRVVLRTALALGESSRPRAGEILSTIACDPDLDRWTAMAVSSSAGKHASRIVGNMISTISGHGVHPGEPFKTLLFDLLSTVRNDESALLDQIARGLTDLSETGPRDSGRPRDSSRDESGRSGGLGTQIEIASIFCRVMNQGKGSPRLGRFRTLYQHAAEIVVDSSESDQLRCQAVDLMGRGIGSDDHDIDLLCELIRPTTPVILQQHAIQRAFSFAGNESFSRLIERWPSMTKTVRDHFVSLMMTRQPTTDQLLGAVESGQIKANDLSPAIRQQLTHTGTRSMRVRAGRLFRSSGSLKKTSLVRTYLDEMASLGDAEKGAQVYKQHCAVCHHPDSKGRTVGASLQNLTDLSDQALLTAILDPNRAVDPKYQSYAIETNDGRILVGAIESEVGSSMTLSHADGKTTVIGRDQIADIKNLGLSLMPEGMESVLNVPSMRDLLSFLQKSRSP